MANSILSTAQAVSTPHYLLPLAARQAIQAKSSLFRQTQKIEQQKTEFAFKNFGCAFGLVHKKQN